MIMSWKKYPNLTRNCMLLLIHFSGIISECVHEIPKKKVIVGENTVNPSTSAHCYAYHSIEPFVTPAMTPLITPSMIFPTAFHIPV